MLVSKHQKQNPSKKYQIGLISLLVSLSIVACDQAPNDKQEKQSKSAVSQSENTISPAIPQEVFWGDLHVHSRLSMDSFSFGNDNLSPEDAFRFAKGEAIQAHTGAMAQLKEPLDFLLVSDHAEYLGVIASVIDEKHGIQNTALGQRWNQWLKEDKAGDVLNEFVSMIDNAGTTKEETEARKKEMDYPEPAFFNTVWNEMTQMAERHNEPGKFTAFTGYEWTSMVDGDNLHRVVIFRDGPEVTRNIVPISSIDSTDPEYLWAQLAAYEKETGGQVMAIPHNGNISEGRQFSDTRNNGEPFNTAYAKTRIRWEPVVEMTQVKGDSETHPLISPDDEFADFENWDETDIANTPYPPEKLSQIYTGGYARPSLKAGLKHEENLGVNPFKFGMIGSTDSHTVMATADSDNFYGKFVDSEPTPDRLTSKMGGILWDNRLLSASGYAAVWAQENTRASLFDALKRKEVYATTGPRIVLRFFGGWEYTENDLNNAQMVQIGYDKGVPMGGDLSAPKNLKNTAPRFMITATKDPNGANLDRVQIVKGWLDENGQTQEKIFDVSWAGERTINSTTGKLPAIGSSVNVQKASYRNNIGADELATIWEDPEFDAALRSFYYVRVLEIPTPRWTTYDAAQYGLELPKDVPAIIQERVYSSPIWYNP